MAASDRITALVDGLIDLFNRRSEDIPDGLFSRQTQFVLNGVPFEQRLGRPATDPLVLMLARGAAGYRFAAKALQHAIPDARLQRGVLDEQDAATDQIVTGQCWLSGHLRGDSQPAEIVADMTLRFHGTTAVSVAVVVDEAALSRLQHARLKP